MQSRVEANGYVTIDALVALAVTTLAVVAGVVIASQTVMRVADVRDRVGAARIAEALYEDLRSGKRPDGTLSGTTEGRAWSYVTASAATPEAPSRARKVRIVVDRRVRGDLIVDAILLPAPVTAWSN